VTLTGLVDEGTANDLTTVWPGVPSTSPGSWS
jgi:hypothetical protein